MAFDGTKIKVWEWFVVIIMFWDGDKCKKLKVHFL
jgi:hypothetical protein